MLVATDFSPGSTVALDLAATMASGIGVEVVLLHVDTALATAPLAAEGLERRERARAALEASRQAFADRSVPVQVLLRPGDPAREILSVARTRPPLAIVMGSHGESRASAPLLGSVVDRVVRYSPYPVLVVPDPTRRSSI